MTLAERLAAAQTAYHDLMTGASVVELTDQNGERIKYTKADPGRLLAYIQTLQGQLTPVVNGSGPMRFWF